MESNSATSLQARLRYASEHTSEHASEHAQCMRCVPQWCVCVAHGKRERTRYTAVCNIDRRLQYQRSTQLCARPLLSPVTGGCHRAWRDGVDTGAPAAGHSGTRGGASILAEGSTLLPPLFCPLGSTKVRLWLHYAPTALAPPLCSSAGSPTLIWLHYSAPPRSSVSTPPAVYCPIIRLHSST